MRRVVTLLVGLLCGSTAFADPPRIAWIGLERGPLPPKDADALEKLLIDELDGYDSFRLVDASGHALDARVLASEAALVARLKNEGIDLALEFKTVRALKKFDQAIDIFESRLIQLLDFELLHDTMLAKAEAQFQSGARSAAKTTLKQLAALSPKTPPTTKTHPAGLVKMWSDAENELGTEGTISVSCDGCTVQIDGRSLGPAPLLATNIRPGKHYLVARWTNGFSYESVQLAPGREVRVNLSRRGPREEARLEVLGAIERRAGIKDAKKAAQRSTKLAEADGTLVAAVRNEADGKRSLFLAYHDSKGEPSAIVKAPLEHAIEDERTATMVKRVGALVFADRKRGELVVAADGSSREGDRLAEALYEGKGAVTETPKQDPAPPPSGAVAAIEPPIDPPPPSNELPPPPPDPIVADQESILEKWWFWTIIGGVAVGAGLGVGLWAGTRPPTTTEFEVILP